jgi:hypothetical protein
LTDERDPTEPEELEVVDGLPVLSSDAARDVAEPPGGGPGSGVAVVPARQVAAMVAGGVAAGAATVALMQRHRTKTLTRKLRKKKGRVALGEVVASNSFLVDVHLLRRD